MSAKPAPTPRSGVKQHWETVYETKGARRVSWYQPQPEMSLVLIDQLRLPRETAIVDVGGGASSLAEQLLSRGFTDLTVLDVSAHALELARSELGASASRVQWVERDLLSWRPQRRYDLWHDRAVFHFLVHPQQRARYAESVRSALHVGGKVIIGTFAADGPTSCSGLPVSRYGPDRLATAFGEGFVTLTTRRELHRTPANSLQPYTWVTLERSA